MKELTNDAMGRPRWSGHSLDWKAFELEWKAYWSLVKHLYSREAKKCVYIRCLPGRYQEHMNIM